MLQILGSQGNLNQSWEKLLLASVLHNILDHIVMPKLTTIVDTWEPCKVSVPIHGWLHPWLPLFAQHMEPLYPTIRYKLGNLFHAWNASDESTYAILSPWKNVFDPPRWEQLNIHFIVPNLMIVL